MNRRNWKMFFKVSGFKFRVKILKIGSEK